MSQATPEQVELSRAVDEGLLDIIKNGSHLIGPDGRAILDNGQPVKKHAPASYFAVAVRRLQQVGVSTAAIPGSPSFNMAEILRNAAQKEGLRLARETGDIPALDEESLDAATG